MKLSQRICGALVVIFLPALYGLGCAAPVDPGVDENTGDEVMSPDDGLVSEAAEDLSGTCHGTVTCPDPKSCGSWSTFAACGTTCMFNRGCGGCGPVIQDPECIPDGTKGLYLHQESFRSCVLQNNVPCTEYKQAGGILQSCGC